MRTYTLHWMADGEAHTRDVHGEEAAAKQVAELAKIDPGAFAEADTDEFDQAMAALSDNNPMDDRVIYLAIHDHGDEGMFVEGGFNKAFEKLGKKKLEAVLDQAINAVVMNAVAMFPGEKKYQRMMEELGIKVNWRDKPASSH